MILKVSAIFSDYDGTLVPAQIGNSVTDAIPDELGRELWNVANTIPICIISSKDYYFLKDKVSFSKILSCILGIETISKSNIKDDEHPAANYQNVIQSSNIIGCKLAVDKATLRTNSVFLKQIHRQICPNYGDLDLELKYTLSENKILSGITVDGRNLSDWSAFSSYKKKIVNDIVSFKKEHHIDNEDLVIQTYSNHPFIDLYAVPCNKAISI